MQGLTMAIAFGVSALVFFLSPLYGLILYLATLAWYPIYLTVKVGTIDFSAERIVILAIFANLFLRTNLPSKFKLIWLDKLVIVYFLCEIASGVITTKSQGMFLENRAGAVLNTALPYFAIRIIITNKDQYLTMLKAILVVSAPLAIIGFYQCLTGHNPVGFMLKYHAWSASRQIAGYTPSGRKGLFRANVTFNVSIMFGLFFAMFGPACAGLMRNINKNKLIYVIGIGLMGVGVFSSMSSGPWLAALIAILFLAFYRFRKHWRLALMVVVLMCASVDIISNRHFYDILGDLTLNPATAWYRSELFERALFKGGMSGHWLTGFGYDVDPGWGPKIDGRAHTDIVNHFLLILSCFGLFGLVPFFVVNIEVIRKFVDAYKASILESDRWIVWCLAAGLLGVAGAFMSVSLFDQTITVYYIMIGFAGVMPAIVTKREQKSIVKPKQSSFRVPGFVST